MNYEVKKYLEESDRGLIVINSWKFPGGAEENLQRP
jgi:hypothetical protein